MESHIRDTYLNEAARQCTFALNAKRGLDNVLGRLRAAAWSEDRGKYGTLHAEVFRSIHSLLTHASNVSRLFWPAPPRRKTGESKAAYRERCACDPKLMRGRDLRDAVGLPQHGHTLRSRQMRDHLEHFDERLDDWQRASKNMNFFNDYIGPVGGISGVDPTDQMRWFDPTTYHLWFRGEEYDLSAVAAAVEDVRDRIVKIITEPSQVTGPLNGITLDSGPSQVG
jgi:hypothetical protein